MWRPAQSGLLPGCLIIAKATQGLSAPLLQITSKHEVVVIVAYMVLHRITTALACNVADICGLADTAWAFISAREASLQDVEQLLMNIQAGPAGSWQTPTPNLSRLHAPHRNAHQVVCMTTMQLTSLIYQQPSRQRWCSGGDRPCAELNLHGHTPSTVAACCIQLMQSVPGGLLSSSMCSRLQACLASRGKGLHTDTLRIHLGTVTSPAIHGADPCMPIGCEISPMSGHSRTAQPRHVHRCYWSRAEAGIVLQVCAGSS